MVEGAGSANLEGHGSPFTPASSRASLRGITSGIGTCGRPHTLETAWIFVGSNLDVLLGALQSWLLTITRVFLFGDADGELIRKLVPLVTEVVRWENVLPAGPPCTLALTSLRIRQRLCNHLARAGVTAILGTANHQRVTRPWRLLKVHSSHSLLGGVTTSTSLLSLFTLIADWSLADVLAPPAATARDLSTIMEYNVEIMGPNVPGPAFTEVKPLKVHQSGVFWGESPARYPTSPPTPLSSA